MSKSKESTLRNSQEDRDKHLALITGGLSAPKIELQQIISLFHPPQPEFGCDSSAFCKTLAKVLLLSSASMTLQLFEISLSHVLCFSLWLCVCCLRPSFKHSCSGQRKIWNIESQNLGIFFFFRCFWPEVTC